MGLWVHERSSPFETLEDTDFLELFAASVHRPSRWLPSWIVLFLLLAAIILFALGHPV